MTQLTETRIVGIGRSELAQEGHGRFQPPTSMNAQNVARPTQVAARARSEVASKPTLFDELRASQRRGAEIDEQEVALIAEAQQLAAQRDRLGARRSELEDQAAKDRSDRMQAALDGAKLAKRSDAVDNLEAIEAARAKVAADEADNARKLVGLNAKRANHMQAEAEIRWRIALARYAVVAAQLVPLAHELAEMSRAHRRGFNWGQGLIIDPTGARDIAGVPLELALELAANLGEEEAQ